MMIHRLADRLMRGHGALAGALSILAVLLLFPLRSGLAQVPTGPSQSILAGSRVFGAKGCVQCHAVKGHGGTVGPDLGGMPRSRSFYDFAAEMWNHLPSMVGQMRELGIAPPRLDAWETADLIAFFVWANYFDQPGDPAAGKRTFSVKHCVVCHQVSGVGGVVGPNLDFLSQYGSPIEIATAMWNHGPAMTELIEARGLSRPAFTGTELTDIIAYLKTASPELPSEPVYVLPGRVAEGRRQFIEKRCIDCHGIEGRGGTVGPDLAQRGHDRTLMEFAAAMWNKQPSMTRAMRRRGIGVPGLRPEEMADLVAYLYSVQHFSGSGNVGRGQQLLRRKRCLSCHSLAGQGGRTAGDLARASGLESPAAVITALWNHMVVTTYQREGTPVSWPRFRSAEMADLTAFLQTLGRAR